MQTITAFTDRLQAFRDERDKLLLEARERAEKLKVDHIGALQLLDSIDSELAQLMDEFPELRREMNGSMVRRPRLRKRVMEFLSREGNRDRWFAEKVLMRSIGSSKPVADAVKPLIRDGYVQVRESDTDGCREYRFNAPSSPVTWRDMKGIRTDKDES